MTQEKFPVNAETLNSIVGAMGAVVMSVAYALPPEQRTKMSEAIFRIAQQAEAQGDTALETLLIDMHRAIR